MFEGLCLSDEYHLPFSHHGISFCGIDDFFARGLWPIENGEVEVLFIFRESFLDDVVRDSIDVIGLLAHQVIDGFEIARLDLADYLFVRDAGFLCHIDVFSPVPDGTGTTANAEKGA